MFLGLSACPILCGTSMFLFISHSIQGKRGENLASPLTPSEKIERIRIN